MPKVNAVKASVVATAKRPLQQHADFGVLPGYYRAPRRLSAPRPVRYHNGTGTTSCPDAEFVRRYLY